VTPAKCCGRVRASVAGFVFPGLEALPDGERGDNQRDGGGWAGAGDQVTDRLDGQASRDSAAWKGTTSAPAGQVGERDAAQAEDEVPVDVVAVAVQGGRAQVQAAAAMLFEGLLRPGFNPDMGAAAARGYVSRKARIAILNHQKTTGGGIRPWEALGVS
jgi:hypothetical protein